ncbi:MAG: hypothetical protein M1822_004699 [Bathelium mastoideum]|nr:MAG: hypothetical protein M1822_004699 [Bathelium mastoideum]
MAANCSDISEATAANPSVSDAAIANQKTPQDGTSGHVMSQDAEPKNTSPENNMPAAMVSGNNAEPENIAPESITSYEPFPQNASLEQPGHGNKTPGNNTLLAIVPEKIVPRSTSPKDNSCKQFAASDVIPERDCSQNNVLGGVERDDLCQSTLPGDPTTDEVSDAYVGPNGRSTDDSVVCEATFSSDMLEPKVDEKTGAESYTPERRVASHETQDHSTVGLNTRVDSHFAKHGLAENIPDVSASERTITGATSEEHSELEVGHIPPDIGVSAIAANDISGSERRSLSQAVKEEDSSTPVSRDTVQKNESKESKELGIADITEVSGNVQGEGMLEADSTYTDSKPGHEDEVHRENNISTYTEVEDQQMKGSHTSNPRATGSSTAYDDVEHDRNKNATLGSDQANDVPMEDNSMQIDMEDMTNGKGNVQDTKIEILRMESIPSEDIAEGTCAAKGVKRKHDQDKEDTHKVARYMQTDHAKNEQMQADETKGKTMNDTSAENMQKEDCVMGEAPLEVADTEESRTATICIEDTHMENSPFETGCNTDICTECIETEQQHEKDLIPTKHRACTTGNSSLEKGDNHQDVLPVPDAMDSAVEPQISNANNPVEMTTEPGQDKSDKLPVSPNDTQHPAREYESVACTRSEHVLSGAEHINKSFPVSGAAKSEDEPVPSTEVPEDTDEVHFLSIQDQEEHLGQTNKMRKSEELIRRQTAASVYQPNRANLDPAANTSASCSTEVIDLTGGEVRRSFTAINDPPSRRTQSWGHTVSLRCDGDATKAATPHVDMICRRSPESPDSIDAERNARRVGLVTIL